MDPVHSADISCGWTVNSTPADMRLGLALLEQRRPDAELNRPWLRRLTARQQVFERELEELCRAKGRFRVLSVGNGLLSEADAVLSYGCFRSEDFVVFDTEADALDFLRCEYLHYSPRWLPDAYNSRPRRSACAPINADGTGNGPSCGRHS
jgi:hypothetical protein